MISVDVLLYPHWVPREGKGNEQVCVDGCVCVCVCVCVCGWVIYRWPTGRLPEDYITGALIATVTSAKLAEFQEQREKKGRERERERERERWREMEREREGERGGFVMCDDGRTGPGGSSVSLTGLYSQREVGRERNRDRERERGEGGRERNREREGEREI